MGEEVLIADDAAFIRRMLKDILTEADFEIAGEAKDGLEVVDLYRKYSPDLVIMDITMPGQDGISAVKDILKIDSKAKVLICSAVGQQSVVIEAIQAGAKDFIVKPFHAGRVLEAISKLLN